MKRTYSARRPVALPAPTSVHNHFASERHLGDRETYKARRAAAFAEWQALVS